MINMKAPFLQIILRLQQQDRPELPPLCELPGQPLPGITDYIKLMKVFTLCYGNTHADIARHITEFEPTALLVCCAFQTHPEQQIALPHIR